MESLLPDILLFPIPFICLFSYLKQVESYIAMFKEHPKLLTGIIIGSLVILVVVIVCNANWVITNCTDASTGGQSDFNAFEGINALFAGLAFIGIAYTIHQQQKSLKISNQQLKESIVQQEKNSIRQSISALQSTLSNLNSLYNASHTKDNAENILDYIHFSEHIYNEIQKIFTTFSQQYQNYATEEQKKQVSASALYNYKFHAQRFLEIAYPLRIIFERIDTSDYLSQRDKHILARQAFTILNHSDVKILGIIYSENVFKQEFPISDTFTIFFPEHSAKSIIASLSLVKDDRTAIEFYNLIVNSRQLTHDFQAIYEAAAVRAQAKQNNSVH